MLCDTHPLSVSPQQRISAFQETVQKGKRGEVSGIAPSKNSLCKTVAVCTLNVAKISSDWSSTLPAFATCSLVRPLSLAHQGPWWSRKSNSGDRKVGSFPWRILVNTFVSFYLTGGWYVKYFWNLSLTSSFQLGCVIWKTHSVNEASPSPGGTEISSHIQGLDLPPSSMEVQEIGYMLQLPGGFLKSFSFRNTLVKSSPDSVV